MKKINGTSASGSHSRVLHLLKCGDDVMLSFTKAGDLFSRNGAIVVPLAGLLKKIQAVTKEK
jgi:hypothetical protein